MDIHGVNSYGTKEPRGTATTLIDLVSRDLQDNSLFPLNASVTRFTRDESLRTVPMSTVMREFTFRGPAEFGQTFTFDLLHTQCGDLIQGLFIQIQLNDWFTGILRNQMRTKTLLPLNTQNFWTYCNSIGTAILDEATLEVDDQVLERITGDSVHVVSKLFPGLNTQIGASDAIGYKHISEIKALDGSRAYTMEDGWVTVPLTFSMLRERLRETFPLISCRDGTIRIRVTLKRFDEVVRIVSGSRQSPTDTPMDKTFEFYDTRLTLNKLTTTKTSQVTTKLKNIQLLTWGIFVDGPYREMLLRQPFERLFREIQHFDFTEPLKYVINKSGNDLITVQLPLEANQPIEEIVWFLRRKASIRQNNDWVNYSATLEKDYDPTYAPLTPLLVSAKIQGNGVDIISQDEEWFRSHIARAHLAGKISYDSFIYGYSFAKHPGKHDPTGTMNASRLNSLRLTLEVRAPDAGSDTEWEAHVYLFGLQWVRFGNGICNKVFID
jgi:hypothetical protein